MQYYTLEDSYSSVIIVEHDLNAKTYKEFEDTINIIIENSMKNIVISFKDVRYMTSSALGLLLETKKIISSRDGNIIFTDMNEYVSWVLTVCGAYDEFKIKKNLNDALMYISKNVSQKKENEE